MKKLADSLTMMISDYAQPIENWTKRGGGHAPLPALATLTASILLSGCASISEPSPIPQDGQTMLEIYRGASADEAPGQSGSARTRGTNCDDDASPAALRRCIDFLKKAQNHANGQRSGASNNDGEGVGPFGGDGEIAQPSVDERGDRLVRSQAIRVAVRQAKATAFVRHPESLNPDYMRSSSNEVRVLFPRLPNPDIEIFVFPHLATSNNVPIPGYSTVMPLYDTVQYAMPGEHRSIDGME